ncbi:MAG: cupin-like domain-containing protein [Myxococcaceae bacterium]|nr:cupin-like domain-containing protein [Myxococcaceae bacterium]
MAFPELERRTNLSQLEFIRRYLRGNRPVVVSDGARDWKAVGRWTPEYFKELLGNEEVNLQGHYFEVTGRTTFGKYIDSLPTSRQPEVPGAPRVVPYLRWSDEGGFTDKLFALVKEDWGRPYFLPSYFYIHPPVLYSDPTRFRYPAAGVYFSGPGAVTRLHADSGISNAVVCQVYGHKRCIIIAPDELHLFPDLSTRQPVPEHLPEHAQSYRGARVMETTIGPGDVLFVPANWLHEVYTIDRSISLTYNFAHTTEAARYLPFAIHHVGGEQAQKIPFPGVRKAAQTLLDGYARIGRALGFEGL